MVGGDIILFFLFMCSYVSSWIECFIGQYQVPTELDQVTSQVTVSHTQEQVAYHNYHEIRISFCFFVCFVFLSVLKLLLGKWIGIIE